MSCCLNPHRPTSRHTHTPARHSMEAATDTGSAREFEYTGKTALTVIGPNTWRRYHFDSPGAILSIDAEDAPSMTFVPFLKPL